MKKDARQEILFANLDCEQAEQLADLISIGRDLQALAKTCERLLKTVDSPRAEHWLIEDLWSAALVRYVRCFSSGKRLGLTDDIFVGLKGDPLSTHQWYQDMRDKHVAHSVNPYDQMHIGIVLTPVRSGERKIVGISTLTGKFLCPDKDGIRQLEALARLLYSRVQKRSKELEDKILEAARNLPMDELYGHASLRVVAPGPRDAGQAG